MTEREWSQDDEEAFDDELSDDDEEALAGFDDPESLDLEDEDAEDEGY